jgi:hypothetical protein
MWTSEDTRVAMQTKERCYLFVIVIPTPERTRGAEESDCLSRSGCRW